MSLIEYNTVKITELVNIHSFGCFHNEGMPDGSSAVVQLRCFNMCDQLKLHGFKMKRATSDVQSGKCMQGNEAAFTQIICSRDVNASVSVKIYKG